MLTLQIYANYTYFLSKTNGDFGDFKPWNGRATRGQRDLA